MKSRAERFVIPALAFVLPGVVMLWVYAALGVAPFGDRTVLLSDMSSQYVEFFCALKNGEVFFSWSKALGTGYIGVFSYYVSSPLSLLTLLAPNEELPAALAVLTALKIALAGLSFALFAQRRFPDCGYGALLGAVCYALMSYNAAYSICIMWLDGVIWLPLILLALERIVAGRGAGPFIAALAVCFCSTWYISYMVGGFCALYLCARLVTLGPERRALGRILARFFGGAACALALTAWLWLPTFLAMFAGKFTGANVDYGGPLACSPLALLGQLRPNAPASITYGAPPFVFCGTAALIFAAAYFFQKSVPARERLANGALLGALAASMVLSPLDKVWHLFQRPNWFPFRYAFLFSFVLAYLAVQTAPRLEGRRPALRRGVAVVLICLSVLELGWNTKSILGELENQFRSDSYAAYRADYAANEALVEAAYADAAGEFFRMGAAQDRGHNSPLAFGYPGLTHYSSLYNGDVNRVTKSLGFAQSWMWCAYYGSTPVTDALLGFRYVIGGDEMPPGYEAIARAGELTLWKNPDTLPIAFCPEAVEGTLFGSTPFERQNSLLACLSGSGGPVFVPMATETERQAGETVLRLVGTGKPLYMDLSAAGLSEVLVNGERVLRLGASEAACVHYLGAPADGETWTVTVRHSGGWSGQLWELDLDSLHAAVAELDNVEVTSVDRNGRVRLSVLDHSAAGLCTTIPAEEGWSAWVDGQRVELETWLDTFLCLDLPAGAREVELRYTPPGLIPGAALGALGLAGLILANTRGYALKKKYRQRGGGAP